MFVSYQVEFTKADFSTDDWGDELLPDVYGGEMKCTATLKLDMELGDFPFDVQDAILRVYQQYDRVFRLVPPAKFWQKGAASPYATPLTTNSTVLISEEWDLGNPLLQFCETNPKDTISVYTAVSVHLKIARRGSGYAVRFMSVMSTLSFSGIFPLLIRPAMDAGDMLAFEVGLLFAVVAFQLLISSFLPVTSTTTVLDMYAIFLFAFIFACMIVITLGSYLGGLSPEDPDFTDLTVFVPYLAGFWGLFHLLYAGLVLKKVCSKSRRLLTPRKETGDAFRVSAGFDSSQLAVAKKVS